MNPLRLATLDASPFYLCSTFGQKGEVRFLTPLRYDRNDRVVSAPFVLRTFPPLVGEPVAYPFTVASGV